MGQLLTHHLCRRIVWRGFNALPELLGELFEFVGGLIGRNHAFLLIHINAFGKIYGGGHG